MPTTMKVATLAVGVLAALVVGGCSTVMPADRSGGDARLLRLATIDGQVNSNGQQYGPETFVHELENVSGERLRVELTTSYRDGSPQAETRLVEAIASGELDGGWPATRAFARAGIHGLEAVEAPMTLTSHRALAELVTGPASSTALESLSGSGVHGLALAEGSLRRPFAVRPLLGPSDWKGVSFRTFNSPVQEKTIRALAGTPAVIGISWVDQVKAGALDGAEFDIAQYAASGYSTEAGQVTTNVVLWPKVFVLSLNQKLYDSLTAQQRGWVNEAARRARDASVAGSYDETRSIGDLCQRGVTFLQASAAQVASLRSSVEPVVAALESDSRTAPLMRQIAGISTRYPDPDVPKVPKGCASGHGNPVDRIPRQTAAIPGGVYRVSIPGSVVAAGGAPYGPGFSGIWTLKIHNGDYVMTCKPLDEPGHDCGNEVTDNALDAGYLRGDGSSAFFVSDSPLLSKLTGCLLPASTIDSSHCYPLPPVEVTWRLDGRTLTFSTARPAGVAYDLTLLPWRRISG